MFIFDRCHSFVAFVSLSSIDSEYLVKIESSDALENQGDVGDGSTTETIHRAISNLF